MEPISFVAALFFVSLLALIFLLFAVGRAKDEERRVRVPMRIEERRRRR